MERQQQLTFWDDPLTESQMVWEELNALREKQNSMRRGLFQRHDTLHQELQKLRDEVEFLRKHLNLDIKEKVVEYDFFQQAHG